MIDQFFGKTFKFGLIALLALFLFAWLSHYSELPEVFLLIIGLVVLLISLNRLEYGIYLAFIELFSSAHGHLISTANVFEFNLSLRMVVFGAVMLASIITMIRNKDARPSFDNRFRLFIPLLVAVIVGFVIGIINSGASAAFSDGNAYLYLGYLIPILMIYWDARKQRDLLQILCAGAIWNIVLSAVILYIFSHFGESILTPTYTFIRDLRIAEVTSLQAGVYRVFMQTQFFVIVFFFLLLSMLIQSGKQKHSQLFVTALAAGTLLLSLSRSFWVGAAFAGLVLLGLSIFYVKPSIKSWMKISISTLGSVLLGAVLLAAIILFPFPQQSTTGADLAKALSDRTEGDIAISSRWNLLGPMIDSIKSKPLEGSGFGATVTFTSDDPRVRALSEDGTWTTVAMEWGWLEVWIKMGILAPIGLMILFYGLIQRLTSYVWTDRLWLGMGLISSLIFLAVTHVFSPYINHPIGLGLILFVVPFLPQNKKVESAEVIPQKILLKSKGVAVAAIKID